LSRAEALPAPRVWQVLRIRNRRQADGIGFSTWAGLKYDVRRRTVKQSGSRKTQQLDFHLGFGLNSRTVDHYFGIGYSFRLDALFGGPVGNSP
jgi:hypothetical protein